jgi:hypothetical protein
MHLVGFIIRNTPTIFVKLLPHPHKESFSVCKMRPTVATLMDVTVGIFILFPFPEYGLPVLIGTPIGQQNARQQPAHSFSL